MIRTIDLNFSQSNYWTQLTNNYDSKTEIAADMRDMILPIAIFPHATRRAHTARRMHARVDYCGQQCEIVRPHLNPPTLNNTPFGVWPLPLAKRWSDSTN